MPRLRKFALISAAGVLLYLLPAQAQGPSSFQSSGDTGAQLRQTDTTWQDTVPLAPPGNLDAGTGNTFPTLPQGYNGMNGPVIPPSTTPLEAPKSGMAGGIPSGQFNYGFPATGSDIYNGVTGRAYNFGGVLPPTSTSSVDLNTVDLAPMAPSSVDDGGPGGWGPPDPGSGFPGGGFPGGGFPGGGFPGGGLPGGGFPGGGFPGGGFPGGGFPGGGFPGGGFPGGGMPFPGADG